MSHPVSVETNTGDGLKMAMRAGAMWSNMREDFWIPVASVPIAENPMRARADQQSTRVAAQHHDQSSTPAMPIILAVALANRADPPLMLRPASTTSV